MSNDVAFPDIDTSYWQTDDPAWAAERKAQWPVIEKRLKDLKSKKALSTIKQYFLKGKMPDWDKFADWDNPDRHVDLFIFIWLHPSWDDEVLIPLRDAYIHSGLIVLDDLKVGLGKFLGWSIVLAYQDYTVFDVAGIKDISLTDHHNEQLFNILMGDLKETRYELDFKLPFEPWSEKRVFELPRRKLYELHVMGRWLCIKTMNSMNEDMLFQYDQPLAWWYQSCETNEDYFKQTNHRGYRALIEKALWRVHNFDTEKEGDTCRTHFVRKVRKILDEREFIVDIKNMWAKVKSGKINPEEPWKY